MHPNTLTQNTKHPKCTGLNVTVFPITSFSPLTSKIGVHCTNHTAFSTYYEDIYDSVLTPHTDLIGRTGKKKVLDQYSREVISRSS